MRKNNIRLVKIFLICGITTFFLSTLKGFSQYIDQFPISESNAEKMIELNNYKEAIRIYSSLLNQEPNNVEYKFQLGKSYAHSNIDRKKGLEILEKVAKLDDVPNKIKKELAIAYFRNYRFDAAEKYFLEYKTTIEDEEELREIDLWLATAKTAKKLYENPIAVDFENLGRDVNSDSPDYLPMVEPDESSILFTSRRSGVVGNLYDYGGYKTADIFSSRQKRNDYSRARSIGSPNTYGNEQTAGRSENGAFMIYNVNSEDFFNDLFVAEKGRRSYMPPKVFDSEEVNQKTNEMGASLSNDGTVMYFCSDREGGLGGFDIYKVQRLPNGNWGAPKNIGAPINTASDEKYPTLQNNGDALYFSSNGRLGMGGMDLFKSFLVEENNEWSEPINLGYPVNTTDDDLNISFAKNNRYAYVAAKRDDSFGDLDIYRISFLDEKDDYTLLTGRVMNADSVKIKEEVVVEVFDTSDESLYGSYIVNPKTGKYSAILPAGSFSVEVNGVPTYQDFKNTIKLLGKNDFQDQKELDIVLQKSQ